MKTRNRNSVVLALLTAMAIAGFIVALFTVPSCIDTDEAMPHYKEVQLK